MFIMYQRANTLLCLGGFAKIAVTSANLLETSCVKFQNDTEKKA